MPLFPDKVRPSQLMRAKPLTPNWHLSDANCFLIDRCCSWSDALQPLLHRPDLRHRRRRPAHRRHLRPRLLHAPEATDDDSDGCGKRVAAVRAGHRSEVIVVADAVVRSS